MGTFVHLAVSILVSLAIVVLLPVLEASYHFNHVAHLMKEAEDDYSPEEKRLRASEALSRFQLSTFFAAILTIANALFHEGFEEANWPYVVMLVTTIGLFEVGLCVVNNIWPSRTRAFVTEGPDKVYHFIGNMLLVFVMIEALSAVVPFTIQPPVYGEMHWERLRPNFKKCPDVKDPGTGKEERHAFVFKAQRHDESVDVYWSCKP